MIPRAGTAPTVTNRRGAPVVRNVARMLSVADVAEALGVSRATVYALVQRGELVRVQVGASIRIPAESLAAFIAKGRREPEKT